MHSTIAYKNGTAMKNDSIRKKIKREERQKLEKLERDEQNLRVRIIDNCDYAIWTTGRNPERLTFYQFLWRKKYMKKFAFAVALAGIISAGLFANDCGKKIVGTWNFDMNGMKGVAEFKADGKLSQDLSGFKIDGTYTVTGDKLTTMVSGQSTEFIFVSCDATTITVKRIKDNKIVVYKKA